MQGFIQMLDKFKMGVGKFDLFVFRERIEFIQQFLRGVKNDNEFRRKPVEFGRRVQYLTFDLVVIRLKDVEVNTCFVSVAF